MRLVLLTCLVAALAGCAGGQDKPNAAELDAMYRSGLDRFDAGDYRTALRRFQVVRELDPKKPGLQHHLGICYAKVGLETFAVESLREAVKQDPKNRDVKLDLAVALEMSKSPNEAEGVYLELLQDKPEDARVVLNLGLLYVQRLNEPEKGREQLQRYLELEPQGPEADEIRAWLEKDLKSDSEDTPPIKPVPHVKG